MLQIVEEIVSKSIVLLNYDFTYIGPISTILIVASKKSKQVGIVSRKFIYCQTMNSTKSVDKRDFFNVFQIKIEHLDKIFSSNSLLFEEFND